jgi:hypothetical protein
MGVDYRWMGDRLGGKPNGVVADYDKLRASAVFEKDLATCWTSRNSARASYVPKAITACHRFKLITQP